MENSELESGEVGSRTDQNGPERDEKRKQRPRRGESETREKRPRPVEIWNGSV